MYRTNPSRGMSPRDRIDPRLIERYARQGETKRDGCGNCDSGVQHRDDCEKHHNHESCDNYTAEFEYTLAMVYSPVQNWQNLYCIEDGFTAGTIFRELNKPFYGPKCHGGNY